MHENEDAGDALFTLGSGTNSGGYFLSPLEQSVKEAAEALVRARPDYLMGPALAQLALDLARNIERGNMKGRAIANEAAQLSAVLDQLKGDGPDESEGLNLPKEVNEFVTALRQPPAAPAPVRDTA